LSSGRTLFVLGDVSGHGVGAAMLMANALAGVRALSGLCDEPVDLVSRLHEQVLRSTDPMSYVTMFIGVLDSERHRLDYVNAGHESPVLIRPGHPSLRLASTGPPVGMLPGLTFDAGSVDFPAGALLGAWSDGIPEAHLLRADGGDPEFFGEVESVDAMLAGLQDRPVAQITDQVFARLDRFLHGQSAPDDVTLLLLRRRA
jgi:phosphoserine phosphatase RsbU/P